LEERRTELGTSEWPSVFRYPLKRWIKDDVVLRIPEGRMSEKRRQTQPKFNKGIKVRGRKEQLSLGRTGPVSEAVRQALVLEVVKLEARFSIRIPKTSVKILWRSRPQPKRKKRLPTAGVLEM
jgi:hypothetical protein